MTTYKILITKEVSDDSGKQDTDTYTVIDTWISQPSVEIILSALATGKQIQFKKWQDKTLTPLPEGEVKE